MPSDEDELHLRLRQNYAAPGLMQVQDAVIKAGPRAWKTAAVLTFGDKETGVVKRQELRVQTWYRRPDGSFGFEQKADHRWSCEGPEIAHLVALLTTDLPQAGNYALLKESSPAAVVARLASGEAAEAAEVVAQLLSLPQVRDALADTGAAASGAALVTAKRQRFALQRLQAAVLNPQASESELHRALAGEWWLFGGRFLGEHSRRRFTSLDQLDIPLLRADGSLHVVELKRANIPKLVVPYRSHLVPGEDVHLAAGQAMNYLRALDEEAPLIRQNFSLDVRRATATVVIGHPAYSSHSEEEVAQTLRTYNSHLARVEVITYAELLAGASVALKVADGDCGESLQDDSPHADLRPHESAELDDPWATNYEWPAAGDDPWAAVDPSGAGEPPF